MQKNSYAFEKIAHRGASAEAPENTLPAIQLAVEKYKVDWVEIDLWLSKEGVPVVIHDETLDRTTDGKGRVGHYTLQELKKYDAGFWFDPNGRKTFLHRGKSVRIPTLEEVLTQFPDTAFYLDVKEKDIKCAEKIFCVTQKIPRKGNLIVSSFEGRVARALRRHAPSSIESFFALDEIRWTYFLFRLGIKKFSPPARYASLPLTDHGFHLDDPRWISFLHCHNVKIFYWTVDEMEKMKELIQRKAEGIVSNFPDRLNQLFRN